MKDWIGVIAPRALVGAGVLAVTGLGGTLKGQGAHAAFTVCRTDPMVLLSNGRQVTLETDISADQSQVGSVSYALHIPRNVSVVSVVYDGYSGLENVQVTSDRNGHHYSVNDVVTMADGSTVPVTGLMSVSGRPAKQADGTSGQVISISM